MSIRISKRSSNSPQSMPKRAEMTEVSIGEVQTYIVLCGEGTLVPQWEWMGQGGMNSVVMSIRGLPSLELWVPTLPVVPVSSGQFQWFRWFRRFRNCRVWLVIPVPDLEVVFCHHCRVVPWHTYIFVSTYLYKPLDQPIMGWYPYTHSWYPQSQGPMGWWVWVRNELGDCVYTPLSPAHNRKKIPTDTFSWIMGATETLSSKVTLSMLFCTLILHFSIHFWYTVCLRDTATISVQAM